MRLRIVLGAQWHEIGAREHRVVVDCHDVIAVQLALAIPVANVVAAGEALVHGVVQQRDTGCFGITRLEPLKTAVR